MDDCPIIARARKIAKEEGRRESAHVARKRDKESDEDEWYSDVHENGFIVTHVKLAFTAAIVQGLGDYDVLLGNQATRPIFKNNNLHTNIRKSKEKVSFDGIGGTVMTDTVGDFSEFGEVYYSDQKSPLIYYPIVTLGDAKTRDFSYHMMMSWGHSQQ